MLFRRIVASPRISTSILTRGMSAASADVASAANVKKLRELSGAPLMDCKNALLNPTVQGDLQKAVDWLRAKGISKVSKSTRETKEGLIGLSYSSPSLSQSRGITLIEVNCETDFVSMNKDFQIFVGRLSETLNSQFLSEGNSTNKQIDLNGIDVLALKPSDSATGKSYNTVEEYLGDIVASIRETIVIKRATVIPRLSPSHVLSAYVHGRIGSSIVPANVQLGKVASVIEFNVQGGAEPAAVQTHLSEALGKKLAMHIVAAKPLYLDANQVPQDFIDKEIEIFREQSKDDKKKPEIIEKIIQGKLSKRIAEVTLLGQNHIAEEGSPVVKKFVETYANSVKATVDISSYTLWNLNQ